MGARHNVGATTVGRRVPITMLAVAAAALAALAVAAAATARVRFSGNVCGLVSVQRVARVTGGSSHCAKAPPSTGPGARIYAATWAGTTGTSPRLQVTVSVYTDARLLKLAKRNLKQGLPPGTPRPAHGIGQAAYEASGASGTGIHFTLDRYVVYLTFSGKTPRPLATLEGIAKTVAARLGGSR